MLIDFYWLLFDFIGYSMFFVFIGFYWIFNNCYRFATPAEATRGFEAPRLGGPELVCGGQAGECSLLPRLGGQISSALSLENVYIGKFSARSLGYHTSKRGAAGFCRPGRSSAIRGLWDWRGAEILSRLGGQN